MLLAAVANVPRNDIKVSSESYAERNQKDRIVRALGLLGEHLPSVDEETLSRYYAYLTARLSFPFTAYYPDPTTTLEEVRHRCAVTELLDPVNDIRDTFDGIHCKTRKGTHEINLPLIELEIPQDSPNFQFIEDYWYWFWNWR